MGAKGRTLTPITVLHWLMIAAVAAVIAILYVTLVDHKGKAASYLGCSPNGYIFRDDGSHTSIKAIDMVTGQGTDQPQVQNTSLNAVGYNPVDNHFYAWDLLNGVLVKVDTNFNVVADWTAAEIGYVGPTNDIFAGDVDTSGTYWFFRVVGATTHWYSIDLTQPTLVTQTGTTSNAPGDFGSDWAYMPGTDNLYRAMDSGGGVTLVAFNRTSKSFLPGVITVTGITTPADGDLGSVYADPNNNMYMSSHISGKLFRVSLNGPTHQAVELPAVDPNNNDGARCALASVPVDFGDAPAGYDTLITDDGPRHSIIGFDIDNSVAPLMLGTKVDIDVDGFPGAQARGDDDDHQGLAGGPFVDDERGVTSIVATPGTPTALTVPVTVTNNSSSVATLAGWIDLDNDTTFEAGERVIATVPANSGTASYELAFPSTTFTTNTYARFRVFSGTVANPLPTGTTTGGEVEDVLVQVGTYDVGKTANPAEGSTVDPGQTVTYTLAIQNTGSTPLTNLKIDDDLTDVLDDATVEGTPTVTPSSAGTAKVMGNTLEFAGDVGVGATVTVAYTVKVKSSGTLGNAALNNFVLASHSTSCHPDVTNGDTTVSDPDCGTSHPVNSLANTGSDVVLPLLLASGLLGVGGVVFYLSRKHAGHHAK